MNENLKSVLGSINKTPSRNSKLSDDLERVKSHLKDVHQHINQYESKQNQQLFDQDDDQFNDVDENVESVQEKLSSYKRSKTNLSYQYDQVRITQHEKTNSEIINQIKQQDQQIQSEKPYKKQEHQSDIQNNKSQIKDSFNTQTFIDKKSQQQQYYFENLDQLNNRNNEENPQIQYGFHQQSQSESVRKLNQKVDQIMSQQQQNQENLQKRNSLQHNKCIVEVPEGEQDQFQRNENYSPTINSIEGSPQKENNVNMFYLQDRNIEININSQNNQIPPYNIYSKLFKNRFIKFKKILKRKLLRIIIKKSICLKQQTLKNLKYEYL